MRRAAVISLVMAISLLALPGTAVAREGAAKTVPCQPTVSLKLVDGSIFVAVTPDRVVSPTSADGAASDDESPDPTDEPTTEPTATPTPEPTATPSPSPTPMGSAEPTTTPSPEPTTTPSAEPTPTPSAPTALLRVERTAPGGKKPTSTCTDPSASVFVENESTGATLSYVVTGTDTHTRQFDAPIYGGQRVTATVTQGEGRDRSSYFRHTSAPSAPTNVIATDITKTSATLTWDRPTYSGMNGTWIYNVSIDGAHYKTKWIHHEVVFEGLKPGTQYTLSVTAEGIWGESNAGVTVITTDKDPTAPTAPQDLRVVSVERTSVTLEWKAPASTGGLPITGYAVSTGDKHYDMTSGTSFAVKGLTPGTAYVFHVSAVNIKGPSGPATIEARTGMDPAPVPVPGKPKGLEATGSTHTTISLKWRPPAYQGTSPVTGYVVKVKGVEWGILEGTSLVIDGLAPGTRYAVEVSAQNKAGAGEPAAISASTLLDPTPAPNPPTSPRALTASDVTKTTVRLDWKEPQKQGGATVEGYLITWGGTHEAYTTATHAQIDALPAGTEYTFSVTAMNKFGASDPARVSVRTRMDPVPIPTRPSVPRQLTVTGVTETSMVLQWKAPASDGGSPIREYAVTWGPESSVVHPMTEGREPATSARITGLRAGTEYVLEVRAVNAMGSSDPAATSAWTHMDPIPTPTPPSAPLKVRAVDVGKSAIALRWDPPASTGGSPLVGYDVSVDGVPYGSTYDTTMVVRALTPGTLYRFDVLAVNVMGTSDPGTLETRTGMDPVPTPEAPSAPLALEATGSTHTTISLSWNPPKSDGGSPVTGYMVTARGEQWEVLDATRVVIDGLKPGQRYAVEVRARNQVGSSSAATLDAWTLLKPVRAPNPPSAPRALSASGITRTSVRLDWRRPATQGGAKVHGYLIAWGDGHQAFTTDLFALVDELEAGTEYTFEVTAANRFGESEPARVTIRTHMDPVPTPDVPSVPLALTATGVTQTSLLLDWRPPASDGGIPISGYGIWVNSVFRELVPLTSARIEGLTPAMDYAFEVRAVNGIGESASATVTARTDERPDPAPGPRPSGNPISGPAAGTNADGSFDADDDERTIRQTVDARWPTTVVLVSGRPLVARGTATIITNAGQQLRFAITYMSPSVTSVVIQKPRKGAFRITATLKAGTKGGRVIVTAAAPPVRVKGKAYEALVSSQQFLVRPAPHKR